MRFGAAALVSLVMSGLLIISQQWRAFGAGFAAGGTLLAVLQVAGFVLAAGGGVVLSTDAVSQERRDGTLGLLLLTPLSGLEIVVGKMFAAVLRVSQWLIAVIPPVAMTLFFGGVRPGDIAALAFALGATLVWSISMALLASAICSRWTRALMLTITFLAVGTLGPGLVDWATGLPVSLASPWAAIAESRWFGRKGFWTAIGLVLTESGLALAVAGWRVRRAIVENATSSPDGMLVQPSRVRRVPKGEGRPAGRRRLLDANPVSWLSSRDRGFATILQALSLACLVGIVAMRLGSVPATAILGEMIGGGLLSLLVNLFVIAHASRFFSEAARNGTLELLAITPLPVRQIVRGPLAFLARSVLIPGAVVLTLNIIQGVAILSGMRSGAAAGGGPQVTSFVQMQTVTLCLQIAAYPLSLAALAWFSLFLGLLCRTPGKSFALSIALGLIVPGVVLAFVTAALMPLVFFASTPGWVSALLSGGAGISVHLVLLLCSRHALYRHFREMATGEFRIWLPGTR